VKERKHFRKLEGVLLICELKVQKSLVGSTSMLPTTDKKGSNPTRSQMPDVKSLISPQPRQEGLKKGLGTVMRERGFRREGGICLKINNKDRGSGIF